MGFKSLFMTGHWTSPHVTMFNVPDIRGRQYVTGRQPWSPGETQADSGGPSFNLIPWPDAVPSLFATANHPGIPRLMQNPAVMGAAAPLLENYLFIAGVQKARG